jgi:ComF family protein
MSRALGAYEGPLRKAIQGWKYEGKAHLTPIFEAWMVRCFFKHWEPAAMDLLVPVPLHPRRLRERGFNQALLLARALSRHTGIPYRKRLLQKERHTVPQVSLSGTEREKGVKGTFTVLERETVKEKTILLIDDVYTTGATVNECARVLLARGAKRVDVLTLAHTLMLSEQTDAVRN